MSQTNQINRVNKFMQDAQNWLPPHGKICLYCGMKDPRCLVRCGNCNNCFCNNKPDGRTASDIIFHLHHSGHSKLYPDINAKRVLSCESCKCTDAFELIDVYDKRGRLCYFCFDCAYYKRFSFELVPLIRDRKVPRWFAWSFPQKSLTGIVRLSFRDKKLRERFNLAQESVISGQIAGLSNETINDVVLKPIPDTFQNKKEYMNIFKSMIDSEEKEENQKRSQFNPNVQVYWKLNSQGKVDSAEIYPPKDGHFVIHFLFGHKVKLLLAKNKYFEAEVKTVRRNWIGVRLKEPIEKRGNELAIIELVIVNVPHQRMLHALNNYPKAPEPETLWSWILCPPDQKVEQRKLNINLDCYIKLNPSQREAVQSALNKNPITLIQGPPGTGKTQTLSAILQCLTDMKRIKKDSQIKQEFDENENDEKILVCAPSNIAVDHLAEKLMDAGMNVIRVYSRSREKSNEVNEAFRHLEPICLHSRVIQEDEHEISILKRAKIICCTCVTAGDGRFIKLYNQGYKFRYVIIDEAAQSLEPETIIPLLLGAKKVILAGDHKQLPPLVFSKAAIDGKFAQSLFERVAKRMPPNVLLTQYRMHPQIAKFPSERFYEKKLKDDVSVINRSVVKFPWPNADHPRFFYHIKGHEEVPAQGESYFNRQESGIIIMLLNELISKNSSLNIGVIVPYQGQKIYFDELKDRKQFPKSVEIASIDGFQGREKDVIVISCVRSNEDSKIGFLDNEKRLNVALTRAKKGLILCGNVHVLMKNPLWNGLLQDYKRDGIIVQGNIGRWERVDVPDN